MKTHYVKIQEGNNTIARYYEFRSYAAAKKALPSLKEGCRVGEGTFAVFDYDPRTEEGGPALISGVRR